MPDPLWDQVENSGSARSTPAPNQSPDLWSQVESAPVSPTRPVPAKMTPEQHLASLAQSDKPLQGAGTGLAQTAGHVLNMPGKALTGFAVRHGVDNPYMAAAIGTLPDLAEDYLMGGRQQIGARPRLSSSQAVSPYQAISQTEQARIAAVHDSGARLGLTLPQPGASSEEFNQAAMSNVPAAESGVRQQLNLPEDAPLSKPFFKGMRSQLGEQGSYGVVRSEPKIPLSDDAISAVGGLPANVQKHLGIDSKVAADGSIGGKDSIKLWSDLKDRASDKWDAYGDSSLTEHKDAALELENAADKVKQSITGHFTNTGRPEVADQLSQDAKTFAQTYSVESALKGKRLDVSKLVRQYSAGAPMEGNMAVIAELGEQYPEAFKLSRIGTYQPGLVKRTAAAVIPKLATAGGAALGTPFGPLGVGGGAVGGNLLGEHIANRILRP